MEEQIKFTKMFSLLSETQGDISMKECILSEKDFEKLYEEAVCAAGSSGIANCAPQHMLGDVNDVKTGPLNGRGFFARGAGTDFAFTNDTMKVHKNRKGKKGDAITGTGIVYANGKFKETTEEETEEK